MATAMYLSNTLLYDVELYGCLTINLREEDKQRKSRG